MRRRDELDYLVEPDLFHDFFGHVPMLAHTVFANFIQAYGAIGAPRARTRGAQDAGAAVLVHGGIRPGRHLARPARLWRRHPVVERRDHLRHQGRRPGAHRLRPAARTRTNYLIDAYQKTYFVLDDIEQLFDSVLAADFEALFSRRICRPTHRMRACPATSHHFAALPLETPRLR
jgi:phenylalanine-4-hydroxylase